MTQYALLIYGRDVAQTEEAARVAEVALVGGAGGAGENGRRAAPAKGVEHRRARVRVLERAVARRASDAHADTVRAVADHLVEQRPEGRHDDGVVRTDGSHHHRRRGSLRGAR